MYQRFSMLCKSLQIGNVIDSHTYSPMYVFTNF